MAAHRTLPLARPPQAITALLPRRWLEERGAGARQVNFKLRDWLFARQRYWGEPFPVMFPEGSDVRTPNPHPPCLPTRNCVYVWRIRQSMLKSNAAGAPNRTPRASTACNRPQDN